MCNGTKLIFESTLDNKVLLCKFPGEDRTVLIPRILFIPKSGEFAFEWSRRQFPVRPAFAMTVNKSQGKINMVRELNLKKVSGQTLKHVGLWLRSQCFTHGQFYVACSRVGKPESLKFALKKNNDGRCEGAKNVVFREILLDK